jgi:hypothetical protein
MNAEFRGKQRLLPGVRWRSLRRFLLATIVLAMLYLAIEQAWYWGWMMVMYGGLSRDDPAQTYASQAVEIASQSQAREGSLGRGHARATFDFGVQYGYLSQWLTRHAKLPKEALQARVEKELPGHLQQMSDSGQTLGIKDEETQKFFTHPAGDDFDLPKRLEDDAIGAAHRVELATSPRLRHVFLLGAMAGIELGRLEPGDEQLLWAPAALIRMHGTLGGVPAELWRPLTRVDGLGRAGALRRYRAAVDALSGHLAAAR